MNLYFQAKMVGYQDMVLKRELGRTVRRQLGTARWKYWLYLVGRVAIIISAALWTLTLAMMLLGVILMLVQNELYEEEVMKDALLAVMVMALFALAPLGAILWHKYDPLKDHLWPPEAVMVTASFFEELIQVEEPYMLHQLAFAAVQSIAESGAAFYLFVGTEHVLMLRKREFTMGDPEQFRAFISQKTGKPVITVK